MGRPVAFRAAAILGYPGEVQPPHFRMKKPKVISGLSSKPPQHVRRLMPQKRRHSSQPRACTHPGRARHQRSGSQDTPRPWGRVNWETLAP